MRFYDNLAGNGGIGVTISSFCAKFAFLFQGKISELEEKYEEAKERKEKMKAFRDIFRNF